MPDMFGAMAYSSEPVPKKTNTQCIPTQKIKVIRRIVNAPWLIRDKDINKEFKIETLMSESKRFAQKIQEVYSRIRIWRCNSC